MKDFEEILSGLKAKIVSINNMNRLNDLRVEYLGKKGSISGLSSRLAELSIEDKPIHGKLPSKLFQEFAIAMKGQRQLVWGRGLKKLLRIDEKTDEELAQETEKNAIELVSVANYAFNLLTIYQKRHVYLELVTADYETGTNTANELLDALHHEHITRVVQTE